MNFGVTFWRVLSYAWKNFARNVWMGLATIFVLVLSLLSVNVLVGVNALLEQTVATLENKVDVTVYFKPETPEAVLQQAQFFMVSLPQVSAANLFTRDQALENFKAQHANDPKILDALSELDQNPLGPSMVVKAKETEDYPFLVEALKNPQFDFAIESKTYDDHALAITRVREVGDSARLFGAILIAIFAVFSVLIVYNAIRVAIYTQRKEIAIMWLVGASGAFVRLPFVFEGLVLAVASLLVTAGLIAVAVWGLEPRLVSFFDGASPGLASFFIGNFWSLLLFEGGALGILVALSSWAAVGRYLKH
jgi:cell division protein FtsX